MALDCCGPSETTRMALISASARRISARLPAGGRARRCCRSGCIRSISMPAKSLASSRTSPGICLVMMFFMMRGGMHRHRGGYAVDILKERMRAEI